MFIKKLWCFIFFVILFDKLFKLFEDKNKIFFKSNYENITDDLYYTLCLGIDSTEYKCSDDLSEDKFRVCKNLRDYFMKIENGDYSTPKDIIQNSINISTLFQFKPNLIESQKFIYLDGICQSYQLNLSLFNIIFDEYHDAFFTLEVVNTFYISFQGLLGSKHPIAFEGFNSLKCENFKECNFYSVTLQPYSLKGDPNLGCYRNLNVKIGTKIFTDIISKRQCLSKCICENFRLLDFCSYTELDTDLIVFNKSQTLANVTRSIDLVNQSYIDTCKRTCSETGCDNIFFVFNGIDPADSLIYRVEGKNFSIAETLLIKDDQFFRKVFAMICLFFKVSIVTLILKMNQIIRLHFKKKYMISIASIILLLCLVLDINYGIHTGKNIYHEYMHRNNSSIFLYNDIAFQPVNFSIALCKEIDSKWINRSIDYREKNVPNFNLVNLTKIRFNEIEENYDLESYRYFYKGFNGTIEKCLNFNLNLKESRWRSLLSMTTLVIDTERNNISSIYFSALNKSIKNRSIRLTQAAKILKIEDTTNVGNCSNYERIDKKDPDSGANKADICYFEGYLEIFKKLPLDCLIYLDYFEDYELKYLYFDTENRNSTLIYDECVRKMKRDCKIVNFLLKNYIKNGRKFDKKFELNLFFEQFVKKKFEKIDIFKLFNSYLNVILIVITITWPKINRLIVFSLNFAFFRNSKEDEKLNFTNLNFLISILGLIAHSIFIFYNFFVPLQVISEYQFTFVNANHFIPSIVFCLEYNHAAKFKINEVITGSLLEERTKNLTDDCLFDDIIYYDLKGQKRNMTSINETDNLKISHFFLQKYKCFQVDYFMNYDLIKNLIIMDIIEFKFKKELANQKCLFTSKAKGTDDFSEYYPLNLTNENFVSFSYYNVSYNDQYQTVKNPMLLFKEGLKINDVTDFMNQLRKEAKAFNFSTKLIPLYIDDEYKDLEINDDLFENLNSNYIKEKEETGLKDLNYERSFFFSRLFSTKTKELGSLKVERIIFSGTTKFESNIELLLVFLNAFLFWFNFYLIDLIDFLLMLANFFRLVSPRRVHRKFLSIKNKLDMFFTKKKQETPILSLNNFNI